MRYLKESSDILLVRFLMHIRTRLLDLHPSSTLDIRDALDNLLLKSLLVFTMRFVVCTARRRDFVTIGFGNYWTSVLQSRPPDLFELTRDVLGFPLLGCVCDHTDQNPSDCCGGRSLGRGAKEAEKTHEAPTMELAGTRQSTALWTEYSRTAH